MAPMDTIWLFLVKDVAFAHHFVATCPSSTLPPSRSASSIGYTSKKYLKWQAQLNSYTMYSRHSKLP